MVHIDAIKSLCNHLIGDNHTKSHKLTVGAFVMIVGVAISKTIFLFTEGSISILFVDGIGYLIHGIGAAPYVEMILKIGKDG